MTQAKLALLAPVKHAQDHEPLSFTPILKNIGRIQGAQDDLPVLLSTAYRAPKLRLIGEQLSSLL